MNVSENESRYEVSCEEHIVTVFIIPDILLIFSFAYGLYIFRWIHTEQLATLTEAVSAAERDCFISFKSRDVVLMIYFELLLYVAPWMTSIYGHVVSIVTLGVIKYGQDRGSYIEIEIQKLQAISKSSVDTAVHVIK